MKRLFTILLAVLFVALLSGCQTASGEPLFKTYYVTGTASVDEEVEQILNDSYLKLTLDGRGEESFAMACEAVISGDAPINAVITFDNQGLCFALPGLDGRVWHVSPELLQGFVSTYAAPVGAGVAVGQGDVPPEMLEMLSQYAQILSGLIQTDSMTTSEGSCRLGLIDETPVCTIMNVRPSAADWQHVLEELCTTALADEQLASLLRDYAGKLYEQGGSEYDADTLVDQFHAGLQNVLENAGEAAEALAQYEVEFASDDDHIYAIRLLDGQGTVAGYESFGDLPDERKDAVMVRTAEYGEIALVNAMRNDGGNVVGSLDLGMFGIAQYTFGPTDAGRSGFDIRINAMGTRVTINLGDEGENALLKAAYNSLLGHGELNVLISDGEETVTLPAGELTEIESAEQLEAVLEGIGDTIGQAFAPAA